MLTNFITITILSQFTTDYHNFITIYYMTYSTFPCRLMINRHTVPIKD